MKWNKHFIGLKVLFKAAVYLYLIETRKKKEQIKLKMKKLDALKICIKTLTFQNEQNHKSSVGVRMNTWTGVECQKGTLSVIISVGKTFRLVWVKSDLENLFFF